MGSPVRLAGRDRRVRHTTAPTVTEAVAALRADGARRVAVAQWILAPGLLPDRIVRDTAAACAPVAAPLGADPGVARAVLDRYTDTACYVRARAVG